MHDPLSVRLIQRVRYLDAETQDLLCRKRASSEAVGQGFPFQELHDEVIRSVLMADVVEGADVRVRDARDHSRLAVETLADLGVRGKMGRKDFDRHDAVEARVLGSIDLSHASCTDRRQDLVGPEPRTLGQCHRMAAILTRAPEALWLGSEAALRATTSSSLPRAPSSQRASSPARPRAPWLRRPGAARRSSPPDARKPSAPG